MWEDRENEDEFAKLPLGNDNLEEEDEWLWLFEDDLVLLLETVGTLVEAEALRVIPELNETLLRVEADALWLDEKLERVEAEEESMIDEDGVAERDELEATLNELEILLEELELKSEELAAELIEVRDELLEEVDTELLDDGTLLLVGETVALDEDPTLTELEELRVEELLELSELLEGMAELVTELETTLDEVDGAAEETDDELGAALENEDSLDDEATLETDAEDDITLLVEEMTLLVEAKIALPVVGGMPAFSGQTAPANFGTPLGPVVMGTMLDPTGVNTAGARESCLLSRS